MKQTGLTLQEGTTSISNLQRRTTLMKSRLLSTAVALFLLLGLVSTSAFAQVSSSDAVDFFIRTYKSDGAAITTGWHNTATTEDTVGRKMDVRAQWETASQSLSSVNYTVTLPVGTVLMANAADSIFLKIYDGFTTAGTPQTVAVSSSDVTLVQNDTVGYSSTKRPSITVTSTIQFNTEKTLQIEAYKGVYVGKLMSKVNSTADSKMLFTLALSSQAGTTFDDSSSMTVVNDLVDGVAFNTSIGGYLDDVKTPFSSLDSVLFVDRFGNNVPDYPSAAGDSVIISVPSGAGYFGVDSVNNAISGKSAYTANVIKYLTATDSTKVVVTYDASYINTTSALTSTQLFHQLSGGTSTMMLLGMRSPSSVTVGGAGLSFNGTDSQDSTTFTVTVYGKVAADTVVNIAADNKSSITRARLASTASKQIGSIVISGVTKTTATYVGGQLDATWTITLKNIFGEAFSGTPVVGTDTDPVAYKFLYMTFGSDTTVNTTNTTTLASGKTVSSKYTMPAATFDKTISGNTDVFTGSNFVGTLSSSALTIQKGTNAPVYMGLASHPANDSIIVVVYAANDASKNDTLRIKVEPGTPVAFDTDTLKANLAGITPTRNRSFPVALPAFALDTAYNRVANLDLKVGNLDTFFDNDSTSSVLGGTQFPMINLYVDGRDPIGYWSATVTDSIRVDSMNYADRNNEGGISGVNAVLADSSFISGFIRKRQDSSVVNIGGVTYIDSAAGDAMDVVMNLGGVNRVLSFVWNPAKLGSGWDPARRSQDVALFSLADTTSVDSSESVTVSVPTSHKAGQVADTMVVRFSLPQGNSIGPNEADSLIYVRFQNMSGSAGLPVGLAKGDVQVSADSINYYDALGVSSITSEDEDSVWLATPITLNASTGAKTVWVRFLTFVNPTVANVDSTKMYPITVKSEATPVSVTSETAMDNLVIADTVAALLVVTEQDTLKKTYPRWLSDVVNVTTALPVTAGVAGNNWRILQVDQYGNIYNKEAGLTAGGTKKLIFTTLDSTSTGDATVVKQTYDASVTTSSGSAMYDTITVTIDTSGTKALYADSVVVTLYNTNLATDYYVVVTDTTMLVRDSVLVSVSAGAVASLSLDPDSNMVAERGGTLPTLSVTLKDQYGNVVPDSTVSIGRIYGSDGSFTVADTAVSADTVSLTAGSNGIATAVFTTGGELDSVSLKVWTANSGVTAKYFTAALGITVSGASSFTFVSPDTTGTIVTDLGWAVDSVDASGDTAWIAKGAAATITANVTDGDKLKKVYVNVWRSELTKGTDNIFTESDPVLIAEAADTTTTTTDSVTVSLVISDSVAIDTAVVISYQLVAIDANDDTTYSDTIKYTVAPKRGKRDMTSAAVNVADVMRLVYLIAIDEIVPKNVDYLGLDLDSSGTFDTPDLTAELAIWKGTGTLLAGAESLENATAKAALSYVATDKATANLALSLESSNNMNVAVFRIKYDTEKFVFGDAKATDRLKNVSINTGNNEKSGVFTIVLVNTEGGRILQGSGAIMNIQISAVGDKFDGVGDISLLSAGFDDGVTVELSREVLSPKALLPKAFALSQNYPNPFNPSTTIAYDVPEGDNVQVQLNVYNMRGQLVRTLVNETKGEGSYQIQWDGSDNYGRRASSGVYFYRIKAGEFSKTRKMVILK